MADQVSIKHAFVSAKVDSSDNSLVSSSEWNAPLLFTGGDNGAVALRDPTKPSGARWGQPTYVNGSTISNYVGPSPSPPVGAVNVTVQDHAVALIMPTIACTVSTGVDAVYTVTIRRNGINIGAFFFAANGAHETILYADGLAVPGTYVYDLVVSVGGAATFTAFNGTLHAIVLAIP
jgi:hypothetical protein